MTFFKDHSQYPAILAHTLLTALLFTIGQTASLAQTQTKPPAPKPPPDVIVFTNGDQLTGKLERGIGDSIIFKSDMAGEISVPLDKIKELRSTGGFAVLRKEAPIAHAIITSGPVHLSDGNLTITSSSDATTPQTIPAKQLAYIIDESTYEKELQKHPGPLFGWRGSVNGGATIVRSTDNGSTYTAGIALVRALPTVPYLPARNRTAFDLQETYGKLTSPVIPQPAPPSPPTPPAVTETSVFHADAERDQYFSPKFFALAQTSFDHNYSQGLNLQQVYGAGIGWTAIKSGRQELDAKASIQYEKQAFQTPSSNLDLIGSTLSEAYHRNLPRKLLFSEVFNILPAWNNSKAYSANGSVGFLMPVFKRLSLGVTTTDNFLNNPSVGYKKNSFQFITAVTYTLR